MEPIQIIREKHKEIFTENPEIIIFAPGRITLIGDHTDYHNGFVMPITINTGVWIGLSKNPTAPLLSVYSIDYKTKMVAEFNNPARAPEKERWFNYPLAITHMLKQQGLKFGGIRMTLTGNIPQNAGLGSSAALEIATGYGIQELYGLKISPIDLSKYAHKAEKEFIGIQSGIMDQLSVCLGKKNNALLLDCKSYESHLVPLELKGLKLVITNSKVPRKLSSSTYVQRIDECDEAVKIMGGESLRALSLKDYENNRSIMTEDVMKRAFHVISENNRVLEAEKALKAKDFKGFGKLMNESHESLKTYYGVSSPELDFLTELARKIPGTYGSRMTGRGIGGCTISLMEEKVIPQYTEALKEYSAKFKFIPEVYITEISDGVHKV